MKNLTLRVAAGQYSSETAAIKKNIDVIKTAAQSASKGGADVLVLPELFVSGYTAASQFYALAEVCQGSTFRQVSKIAADNSIAICYGYPERDGEEVFNSCQLVDDRGNPLINHRKTQLFGNYEKDWFSPGNQRVQTVRFKGFTLSTIICYEIEFPEPARACALSGANVILVPTAITDETSPEQVSELLVRARAAENAAYVVYVNHARGENTIEFTGNSLVAGPFGKVLAKLDGCAEGMIFADISTEAIAKSNAIVPYLADIVEGTCWSSGRLAEGQNNDEHKSESPISI